MCPPPDENNTRNFFLDIQQQPVYVRTYGKGKELLIAFHGYDYDGSVFASWAEGLGDQYTICAPDLPFHGQTAWAKSEFTPDDIQQIIAGVLQRQSVTRYSLVGHSLGARLIVCNANAWAEQVEQFILLAPAGIGSFDRVPPLWVQQLIEKTLAWPAWLAFFVNLGHRLGLVSNFRKRYAEVQLYPVEKRTQLFRVYNSLRHLRTSQASCKHFWQSTSTATLVILAEQDRFVPNVAIRNYFAKNKEIALLEIASNHDLVNAKTAELVRENIQISQK